MPLHHVNFHTFRNEPVFEDDRRDEMMRRCLSDVLQRRGILCPAWEIMPTHVHLIIQDFPDLSRPTILKHVKGDTSRAFFATFPELRIDLDGGHLWRQGYFAAMITTHRQYLATLEYIHTNRVRAGLLAPALLTYEDNT